VSGDTIQERLEDAKARRVATLSRWLKEAGERVAELEAEQAQMSEAFKRLHERIFQLDKRVIELETERDELGRFVQENRVLANQFKAERDAYKLEADERRDIYITRTRLAHEAEDRLIAQIERLEAERDEAQQTIREWGEERDQLVERWDALTAERDEARRDADFWKVSSETWAADCKRLRAALVEILNVTPDGSIEADIARAALAGEEKP
jgi:chromosome segregation ATPase